MIDLRCLVHTYMSGSKKGMPIKCASALPNKNCKCQNCKIYQKARARIYYDKNKDKILQKGKEWYKNNKEHHNKITRNNYKQNKKTILKKQKEWKEKNKEKNSQNVSNWKKNNREKIRLQNHRRKARRQKNNYELYTEKQVLDLYGNKCYLCNKLIDFNAPRKCGLPGWQNGLHIEHVIDIAKGGPDTIANVRPAHAICNLTKKPVEMV